MFSCMDTTLKEQNIFNELNLAVFFHLNKQNKSENSYCFELNLNKYEH